VRCCIGCNASKGTETLVEWLRSKYCISYGITRNSVAAVVRFFLESKPAGVLRRDGNILGRKLR
jgi:hypothetical protein